MTDIQKPSPHHSANESDSAESDLIERFELSPHPEGGYFKEVFRSSNLVKRLSSDNEETNEPRSALTDIYFLLGKGDFSCFHRVFSDEAWHHLSGGPLTLITLSPDLKQHITVVLESASTGNAIHVVPASWWQAAIPVSEHSFCSCSVGPGFDFSDFEMAKNSPAGAKIKKAYASLNHLV